MKSDLFRGIFYHPSLKDEDDSLSPNSIVQSEIPLSLDFLDGNEKKQFKKQNVDSDESMRRQSTCSTGWSFSNQAVADRNVPARTTKDERSFQFSLTKKTWLTSAGNEVTETESSSEQHSYIPEFKNRIHIGLMDQSQDLGICEPDQKIINPYNSYKIRPRNLE